MLKLAVIVPYLNQVAITEQTLKFLAENRTNPDTEIIAFNNDSEQVVNLPEGVLHATSDRNLGTYYVFSEIQRVTKADIIAVIHSDLFIYERGYDQRILDTFVNNQNLGLLGVIGSNEIDQLGGRGGGTISNFQGRKTLEWSGSPAEAHGKRTNGFVPAAVVDGCVMIFRKKALEEIGINPNMPLHHFYDRYMACQCLERQWQVGVLGLEVDHISGQTANTQNRYTETTQEWWEDRGINTINEWVATRRDWIDNIANTSRGHIPDNWDSVNYLEAERIFLQEYKVNKKFIPIKI